MQLIKFIAFYIIFLLPSSLIAQAMLQKASKDLSDGMKQATLNVKDTAAEIHLALNETALNLERIAPILYQK